MKLFLLLTSLSLLLTINVLVKRKNILRFERQLFVTAHFSGNIREFSFELLFGILRKKISV